MQRKRRGEWPASSELAAQMNAENAVQGRQSGAYGLEWEETLP